MQKILKIRLFRGGLDAVYLRSMFVFAATELMTARGGIGKDVKSCSITLQLRSDWSCWEFNFSFAAWPWSECAPMCICFCVFSVTVYSLKPMGTKKSLLWRWVLVPISLLHSYYFLTSLSPALPWLLWEGHVLEEQGDKILMTVLCFWQMLAGLFQKLFLRTTWGLLQWRSDWWMHCHSTMKAGWMVCWDLTSAAELLCFCFKFPL